MNERDMLYWLRGFFELTDAKTLTEKQVEIIKNHLDLVFEKITPDVDLSGTNLKIDSSDDNIRICSSEEKLDRDKIAKALRASYHRPWNGPTHYC